MRIAILLNAPYPFGMASTNRIHLYAKGLLSCRNEISIFIPKPTENPGKVRNTAVAGKHEGINYYYGHKTTLRSSKFLKRRIDDFLSLFRTLFLMIKFKPAVILLVGSPLQYIFLGKIASAISGSKYIREKSEIPFSHVKKLSFLQKLRIKAEYRLFDGIIVISTTLGDFFQKEMSLKTKTFDIPILIDSDKINPEHHLSVKVKPNLVYTGSLLNNKDGVLTIIKAFSAIMQRNSDFSLYMTGEINESPDKDEILSLIRDLKLKENIVLTGYISKEKLLELTSTATALLLAKPDNRQNRYNMATKIGEYLLTGRPVIVSNVDPVSQYLSHKTDAFIVNPAEEDFAGAIEFIIANPGEAKIIGQRGKSSALKFFDYKIHALRMNEFLKSL